MNTTTSCAGLSAGSYTHALWQDIIQSHWDYLEVEENMDKLDKRTILEGQIRKQLCNVNHSQKFDQPSTYHVLSETVRAATDFSACSVMNGFEAVHQYANNLLTKPWRPEFKTIRTYSGFYKQDVERHLVDVELMFVAMGYKKTADGSLVLKGQLCMDQVANVSRDALSAYVECQIMSEIFGKCLEQKLPIQWMDVFRIRQNYIGDIHEAVKICKGFYCSQFANRNVYANMQPSTICNVCSSQCGACTCNHAYSNGHFVHNIENLPQPPPPTSWSTSNHRQHPFMHEHLHSKSLDQYGGVPMNSYNRQCSAGPSFADSARQSRSFDQPTFVDYSQTQPIIVAGQRFSLPCSESQHFQHLQPNVLSCANAIPPYDHNAGQPMSNGYQHGGTYNVHYPSLGHMSRTISDPSRIQQEAIYNNSILRQLSLEHSPHDHHSTSRKPTDDHRHLPSQQQQLSAAVGMSSYAQMVGARSDGVTQTINAALDDPFVSHHFDYTENLKAPLVPQRARNHYDHYDESSPNTNGSETSRGVSDFDSFDEAATQVGQHSNNSRSSSSRSLKNDINGNGHHHHQNRSSSHAAASNHREQDGVGSYDTWNVIYNKINKSKARDQIDINNLNLQGLDLNQQRPTSTRNLSSDKKLGRGADDKVALISPSTSQQKSVSAAAVDVKQRRRNDESILTALQKLPAAQAEYMERSRSRNGTLGRKAPKDHHPSLTVVAPTRSTKPQSSSVKHQLPTTPATTTSAAAVNDVVSNRNEWSCAHCTLLNPITVHICAACAKTKDLITMATAPKATTTCV